MYLQVTASGAWQAVPSGVPSAATVAVTQRCPVGQSLDVTQGLTQYPSEQTSWLAHSELWTHEAVTLRLELPHPANAAASASAPARAARDRPIIEPPEA